jgi:thymidylate synthase
MALPPCHTLMQFYVSNDKKYLSCQLYQRSADMFLGVPFNIASYALLTCMIAQVCGYEPKEFVHTTGDTHIYLDHVDVVKTQIQRTPKKKPRLVLNPEVKSIFDFKIEDIKIEDYVSDGKLVGKVSV